jgi:hypothetical protein
MSSYLVAKQEYLAKEIITFAFRSVFSYFVCSLSYRKILRHGSDGFTFPPKEVVLRIFIAVKNTSPPAGLEPANIGSNRKHANDNIIEGD